MATSENLNPATPWTSVVDAGALQYSVPYLEDQGTFRCSISEYKLFKMAENSVSADATLTVEESELIIAPTASTITASTSFQFRIAVVIRGNDVVFTDPLSSSEAVYTWNIHVCTTEDVIVYGSNFTSGTSGDYPEGQWSIPLDPSSASPEIPEFKFMQFKTTNPNCPVW
eukprot:CAMPEP_0170484948 /NCGR_PEP_ID=MMETSP0208-20121228/4312_1 /TAXON_ID=197538 /ORGANISM="Strombidium inclinatum, Strain S3" /LENGTH=169 /DNA_ID=CAMNT_0010758435 /DNA_START=655 /DNA_END=1161 /DNA_ORIENTATION=+